MVSTRTQDGTTQRQATSLPHQETEPLPDIQISKLSSALQANKAAFKRNKKIPPLKINPRERRTSILTGKRPTVAQLRASKTHSQSHSQSSSPKSVRFREGETLTPKTPTSGGLKDPLESRVSPASSPISILFPPPPSTSTGTSPTTAMGGRRKSQRLAAQQIPTSQDLQYDMSGSNNFFPSVIIGAKEVVGLSKIARADKEVEEMEQILKEHEEHAPHLAGAVQVQLERLREMRSELDDKDEANLRVGAFKPAKAAIEARLKSLQWGLETSKFTPEAANIKCAIAGYESGLIPYSDHFTLIYAGHIVDVADSYSDTVRNRMARLDSYAAKHGEGWFWYEPPLSIHPESQPKALLGMGLDRAVDWTNLAPYYINEGFWKRDGYVRRLFGGNARYNSLMEKNFFFDPENPSLVYCQDQGPRLSFRSILDSGATYPSLHTEDLMKLGIDMNYYAAQSISTLNTANGDVDSRIFEMFVCVVRENGTTLVDEKEPVWPGSHKYLGGLCPVAESIVPLSSDANGLERSFRLSGMLPFLACYMSSTPTRSRLWFGEDRNDVLGHYRMPGQKKWSIEIPPMPSGLPENYYDNPKIEFVHRQGEIIDQDFQDRNHASRLLIQKDTINEKVIDMDPAAMQRFRPPAPAYVSKYVPPLGGGFPGVMPSGSSFGAP